MPQVERPQEVSDAIDKLLRDGTVEELKSEKGKFLRLFMTADEVYRSMDLPIAEARGFDGSTCDYCRGDYRFSQCGKCAGTFDNVPTATVELVSARKVIEAQNAARGQALRDSRPGFFERLRAAARYGLGMAKDEFDATR